MMDSSLWQIIGGKIAIIVQKISVIFRHRWINADARANLKSGLRCESRPNLQVPMHLRLACLVASRGIDDLIIIKSFGRLLRLGA